MSIADYDATSANYKWKVAAVVSGTFLFSAMDMNSSLVALPTIADHFMVDITSASWIVLAAFMTLTALLLPFGRLADMVGRKRVMISGMLVVGCGGILSALAPDLSWLYGTRILQGAGAAAVQAVGPALLVAAFPREERGKAMGVNVTMVSVGLMLGPALGGLVVASVGWRYIFLFPVPMMLLAAIFGWKLLRESARTESEKFDYVGTVLLALWIAPLFFVLNQGSKIGWGSGVIVSLSCMTIVVLTTFLLTQLRQEHPLVELKVFRNRDFSLAVSIAVLNFMAFGATLLLLPFMLQKLMNLGVATVGFAMATMSLPTLIFAPFAGRLSDQYGPRITVTVGLVVRGTGLIIIGLIAGSAVTVSSLIAPMILMGVGQALFQPPNASAMLSALPPNHAGLAGGFLALSRTLGMGIGQSLGGVVFTMVVVGVNATSSALDAGPEMMASGFRVSLLGAGVLLLATACLAMTRTRYRV